MRLHPKGATISTNMCPHLNHQKLNVIRTSGSDYVSLVNFLLKMKRLEHFDDFRIFNANPKTMIFFVKKKNTEILPTVLIIFLIESWNQL